MHACSGWNLGQHRLPGGKHNVYDHSTRIPMVIRGPGITAGSRFTFPASNVDIAPTVLGLAGVPELAAHMDGRSIVPMLVDPADAHVLPATRAHIHQERAKQEQRGQAGAVDTPAGKGGPWRTFHPIEFIGLNNYTWFGHLIDDVVSNTYRALRFVGDPVFGELLYAEFTSMVDWHYDTPVHYELFNMSVDPHQLKNLYYTAPKALTAELQKLLLAHWACAGATCP